MCVLHMRSQGSGSLNLTLLEEKLDQDAFTYSIKVSSPERGLRWSEECQRCKAESPPSMAGTIPWHEKVKEVLTVIEVRSEVLIFQVQ